MLVGFQTQNHILLIYSYTLDSFEHNESLKCERLKYQKDRKKPESCHPFHPEVCETADLHTLSVCMRVNIDTVKADSKGNTNKVMCYSMKM